jgi:hypothetical protein
MVAKLPDVSSFVVLDLFPLFFADTAATTVFHIGSPFFIFYIVDEQKQSIPIVDLEFHHPDAEWFLWDEYTYVWEGIVMIQMLWVQNNSKASLAACHHHAPSGL